MRTHTRNRRVQSRRYHLLLSAGIILTAGVVAPTLEAARCSARENGFIADVYPVKSVLPFLSDRCVQVKPVEQKLASPILNAYPSQHPTALSGDRR